MPLLVSLFAGIAWDPHLRGALAVFVGIVVLCGSVYLLLGTNLGARLGLLVALAGLAGWMVILTLIWWIVPPGIGPRGESSTWQAVEVYVDGPDAARTDQLAELPRPQDFPDPDRILAENPDLAEEYPTGFALSDLESTHPELVEDYLDELELGGWRLVSTSDAGEAQAAADVALVDSGFFSGPTDYKKLDSFDYGGKQSLAETCPDVDPEGSGLFPDEPLCRVWHKLRSITTLRHPPHYAVVQVQQVVAQEPREGEPPPTPQVDPNAPVVSVVLLRDLGTVRLTPFLYFVISFALFVFFVVVLHYRDKTLKANLDQAEAAKGA
jgi:hypothetical protein